MKQRITVEQIKELSEEQRQKLRDWWKPSSGDQYTYQEMNVYFVYGTYYDGIEIIHYVVGNDGYNEPFRNKHRKERCLPVLSIGQMIELLNGKEYAWSYENDLILGKQNELCDALWNAVKSVLSKEATPNG